MQGFHLCQRIEKGEGENDDDDKPVLTEAVPAVQNLRYAHIFHRNKPNQKWKMTVTVSWQMKPAEIPFPSFVENEEALDRSFKAWRWLSER